MRHHACTQAASLDRKQREERAEDSDGNHTAHSFISMSKAKEQRRENYSYPQSAAHARELLLSISAKKELFANTCGNTHCHPEREFQSTFGGKLEECFLWSSEMEQLQQCADKCKYDTGADPEGTGKQEVVAPVAPPGALFAEKSSHGNAPHADAPVNVRGKDPLPRKRERIPGNVAAAEGSMCGAEFSEKRKAEDNEDQQRRMPPWRDKRARAVGFSRSPVLRSVDCLYFSHFIDCCIRGLLSSSVWSSKTNRESVAMEEIVIVSAARTPVGKFQGSLAGFSATQLGAIAVREAVRCAGVDPASVDECIMGNVVSAGLGQNPARQAALHGGLPSAVGALTINKVCGSGLKAVALAAQAIQTGNAEIVVAGGMESMTNAPYLLPQARSGFRMGNATAVDSMVNDGLWDSFNNYHMGQTAENVAEKYGITREEQDDYALNSHRKAAAAWKEGRFQKEIVPVEIPAKKKGQAATFFDHDESIREDASLEALSALKPAFKKDGTVTAGNAPSVNDAAAALVVMSAAKAKALGFDPMARIRAQATSGVDPAWVMMAPVTGVQKLLAKVGWAASDVDLFELNEAFAVQAIGVTRELGIPFEKVNVNGGAVAIGHPIGASGARVLTTLIYEMIRRDVHRGVAALCLGGGNSVAMAVER